MKGIFASISLIIFLVWCLSPAVAKNDICDDLKMRQFIVQFKFNKSVFNNSNILRSLKPRLFSNIEDEQTFREPVKIDRESIQNPVDLFFCVSPSFAANVNNVKIGPNVYPIDINLSAISSEIPIRVFIEGASPEYGIALDLSVSKTTDDRRLIEFVIINTPSVSFGFDPEISLSWRAYISCAMPAPFTKVFALDLSVEKNAQVLEKESDLSIERPASYSVIRSGKSSARSTGDFCSTKEANLKFNPGRMGVDATHEISIYRIFIENEEEGLEGYEDAAFLYNVSVNFGDANVFPQIIEFRNPEIRQ